MNHNCPTCGAPCECSRPPVLSFQNALIETCVHDCDTCEVCGRPFDYEEGRATPRVCMECREGLTL